MVSLYVLIVKHTVFLKKQPFLEFLCEIMLHNPCGKQRYDDQRNMKKVNVEDVLEFLAPREPQWCSS